MSLIGFLSSGAGRLLRAVVGLVLIGVGVYLFANNSVVIGLILGFVGLVPLLASIEDICLFAPLFGAPFKGSKIRQRAHAV